MNYNKKGFLSLALVGSLSLNFVLTACHGKSTAETTETNTKKVYVGTWAKVDAVAFDGHEDVMAMAVSGDKSHVYVALDQGKYLSVLDVGADFAKSSVDPAQWHKIELQMNSGGVGKAELHLDPNNKIIKMDSSSTGAFVSIDGALEKGAWYLEGRDFKAGWASNGLDIAVAALPLGTSIYGLVTKKANNEYPLILAPAYSLGILTNSTFATPSVLSTNDLNRVGMWPFDFNSSFATAMGTTDFYIIDKFAISVIPSTALGEAAMFSAADPRDLAFHVSLKQDQWGTLGGKVNKAPRSAFFDNGNLYIGFMPDLRDPMNPNRGGVAVHNVVGKITKAPHTDWTGIEVLSFTKDEEGNVWAVTKNALIEVVIGATTVDIGKKFDNTEMAKHAVPADPSSEAGYTAIVDGSGVYANTLMPADISSAAFLGKHLLITSSTAGVHVLTFKEKSYKKP